jgi:uncharacterized protein (TIRG00374 family)
MKRWQTLLIGIGISAIALYLAFRQTDIAIALASFRTARYSYVALGVGITLIGIAIRGWRWWLLTNRRLSLPDSFWLWNVGFFFNNILPARLGEAARALLAGRRQTMSFASAFSSIVIERLFDMVSVVVMLGIALIGLDLPIWARSAGIVMGLGAAGGIVFLALAARHQEWALTFGSKALSILPRVSEDTGRALIKPFIDGLSGVSDWRIFLGGLGVSIFAWLVSAFATWAVLLAFWPETSFIRGVLVVATAGLGFSVPSAPSGVGPYEAAVIGTLTALGYEANASRIFAVGLHVISFSVTSLLGIIGLLREGVSIKDLTTEASELKSRLSSDSGAPASTPTET